MSRSANNISQKARAPSRPAINSLDHSNILPGDLAVNVSGVHTMAYLGDKTWIEADPGVKRVIRVSVPARNPWFEQPVYIVRWSTLDERSRARWIDPPGLTRRAATKCA